MNKSRLSTIFVFVIIAIVIPIVVNVTSDFISNRLIDDSDEQVKFSSVNLNFWLDSVGKTEFERGQKVGNNIVKGIQGYEKYKKFYHRPDILKLAWKLGDAERAIALANQMK